MKAIAIVLACASWAAATEPESKSFSSAGLTALSVETAGGDIVVEAGGERVEVTVEDNDPALCVVITERKGATLIVKADDKSRGWLRRKGCEASFRIKAPAALRVSASAAAGDLRVAGIKGALILGTGAGAGDVRLSFPEGTTVEAALSSGVGSASNEFGDTKGAALRVTAASGIGDVVLARKG